MRSRVRAGVALGLGLADADDGEEAGAPGGGGLGGDERVGLAVVGAALGVADDDRHGAGVGEHLGGDVAGVGARGLRVAVLAAEREGAAGEAGEQRRGRADQDVAARGGVRAASSSSIAADAARPFIFQFPATSLRKGHGRRLSVGDRGQPASRPARSGKAGISVARERPAGPVAGGLGVVEGGVGQRPVAHAGGGAVAGGVGELSAPSAASASARRPAAFR